MRLEKFININDWMQQRPYMPAGAADRYLLTVWRGLFGVLEAAVKDVKPPLPAHREDLRELAWIFTSYFEDRVSGLGFWDGLVTLHRRYFGKRLPFFTAETLQGQESEYDDLLPADIHYLAWLAWGDLYTVNGERPPLAFDTPFFRHIAEAVFNWLDAQEEVVNTGFFEDFLTPSSDYYELRSRLTWFGMNGYLTRLYNIAALRDFINHQTQQNPNLTQQMASVLYIAERERLLFEAPTSCVAARAVDLFAAALRATEAERTAVVDLGNRVHGIFLFEEMKDGNYLLRHTGTDEVFAVSPDSFAEQVKMRPGQQLSFTLTHWQGKWLVSGQVMENHFNEDQLRLANFQYQQLYHRHYTPYREKMLALAGQNQERAVSHFGSELVVFPSGAAMKEALDEYGRWLLSQSGNTAPDAQPPDLMAGAEDLLGEKDIAIFLSADEGLQFLPAHHEFVSALRAAKEREFSDEEVMKALFVLSDEGTGAAYWRYLYRQGELAALPAMLRLPSFGASDLEALLRVYVPQDFSSAHLPNYTIVDTGGGEAEAV